MKTIRRTLISMLALLAMGSQVNADPVVICEIHPNYCAPTTKAYRPGPAGSCPENMVACANELPAASMFCDSGLCQAFPQAFDNSLTYQWSASNANVTITPFGAELLYSCEQNASVLFSVTVSDNYGNQRMAQEMVFCRRQSGGGGNQQPQ